MAVSSQEVSLFRPGISSIILEKDLTITGVRKPWTLGNYIAKQHRSSSDIRFGVGLVDRHTASSVLQVWIVSLRKHELQDNNHTSIDSITVQDDQSSKRLKMSGDLEVTGGDELQGKSDREMLRCVIP